MASPNLQRARWPTPGLISRRGFYIPSGQPLPPSSRKRRAVLLTLLFRVNSGSYCILVNLRVDRRKINIDAGNCSVHVDYLTIQSAIHAGADPGETLNLDSAEPLLSLGYPRLREARQGACQTEPRIPRVSISSCRPFCHRFCHQYDLKRYTVANNHAISSSLSQIIFTAASLIPVPPFPPEPRACSPALRASIAAAPPQPCRGTRGSRDP